MIALLPSLVAACARMGVLSIQHVSPGVPWARQRDEEPVYSQLNKLLERNQLRAFVDSHPEFSWSSNGPKGMLITWALDAPPLAPSSASAEQALLALPAPVPSWLDQDLGQVQEEGTA